MAVDPSVRIDIAAEFTGVKAFNKADKSVNKLGTSATNLGKKLAIAFSTTAILSFAKASVKAFAEEDKAIKSLSRTLKNLGFTYSAETGAVNNYIETLSKATGVFDDELRPAFETLLRATGSITKSQDLLALALDISAGTGKDLGSVVAALQKAYLGNNQALIKLGVGLTKAELASGDFEAITAKLGKLFAGQAADAADSYAGQINKLSIAADNAKEIIGKSLVDAIGLLGSADTAGIDKLTTAMEDFATYIGNAIYALGILGDKLNNIPGIPAIFKWLADNKQLLGLLGLLSKIGEDKKKGDLFFPTGGTGALEYRKEEEKAAKLAAKRLADEKKAAAAKDAAAKKAATQTARLAKASAMFDLEKIQVAAALKGRITAEEKLRLELQQAILDQNDELADKLQKKLEASQIATAALAAQIVGIKPPVDPFAQTLDTLESIAILLGRIAGVTFNPMQNKDRNYDLLGGAVAGAGAGLVPGAGLIPGAGLLPGAISGTVDTGPPAPFYPSFSELENMFPYIPNTMSGSGSSANITVNVDAGTVVMQDDLVTIINDAVIAAQKNGYTQLPNGAIVG
jgi:hypothetical protein